MPKTIGRPGETQISLLLPTPLLNALDEFAKEQRRTRKDTVILMLEEAIRATRIGLLDLSQND